MKKTLVILLLLVAGAQSWSASPLVKSPQESEKESKRIRRLLGKETKMTGLKSILETNERGGGERLHSSNLFKGMLAEGISRIHQSMEYATPIPIDPTMTSESIENQKKRRWFDICVHSLAERGKTLSTSPNGLGNLFQIINWSYVIPQRKTPLKVEASSEKNRILGLIKDHLSAIDRSKNIEESLGSLTDIVIVNGAVRTLIFVDLNPKSSTYGRKIELSLSMLISHRTEEDDAFVAMNTCLNDLVADQKTIFSARLQQLDSHAATAWTLEQIGTSVQFKGFPAHNLMELQNVKPDFSFYWKLSYYSQIEGTTKQSLAEEKEYINDRLATFQQIDAYLADVVRGATQAHAGLEKLKTPEVDALIDMMLQLRQNDIIPAAKIFQVQRDASANEAKLARSAHGYAAESVTAELEYLTQTAKDLSALEARLSEEARRKEFRDKDIKEIKKLGRQR